MLGRSWGVPVLAALGSWLCMFAIHGVCSLTSGVGVRMRMLLGWINSAIWLVLWLLLLGLVVWLLVFTVRRLIQRQWKALLAWVWSALAVKLMSMAITVGVFITAFSYQDDFTYGLKVPEKCAPGGTHGMAVPRGMHFQPPLHEGDDAELPAVVQQYADLCKVDTFMCVDGDEALPSTAPNLEKLAAEAPELLHEYGLRAYCHEALTPGFHACRHLESLRHPDAAAYLGKHYLSEHRMYSLANGWGYLLGNGHSCSDIFARKGMQLLDESLAPLAARADRETLDSLVPSLPDKPFIMLAQVGQPGMYRLVLVAPADYPAGTFCVNAREYTQNKTLSIRNRQIQVLRAKDYRKICQLSEPVDFTVYSGEWGEYYASVWELHFTPDDGNPSRCVNSQLYLMQGWSR